MGNHQNSTDPLREEFETAISELTPDERAELLEQYKAKKRSEYYPQYDICGVVKTSEEWAKEAGIKKKTFLARWRRGDRGTDLIRPTIPRTETKHKRSPHIRTADQAKRI